ncbi:MAG TPA: four-helix bundle copper-binding protein [Opitutus sp.]|nr:four-helix bundle copper-binding protein [Opitutus sp.]
MRFIETMLRTHPRADRERMADYASVIDALEQCAGICSACADACLGEAGELLRRCIQVSLDCADVCAATARLVLRQTETPNDLVHAQLHACALACRICAEECEALTLRHQHCRVCAEACRQCQERCNFLIGELSSSAIAEDVNPGESPSML